MKNSIENNYSTIANKKRASLSPTKDGSGKKSANSSIATKEKWMSPSNFEKLTSPKSEIEKKNKSSEKPKWNPYLHNNQNGSSKNLAAEAVQPKSAKKGKKEGNENNKLEIIESNLKQLQESHLLQNPKGDWKNSMNSSKQASERSMDISSPKYGKETLIQSMRMRQNKFFEIVDSTVNIREKDDVLRDLADKEQDMAEGYEIAATNGASKAWNEFTVYDRNNLWLTNKNDKLKSLHNNKVQESLKECTFHPVLSKYSSPKNFTPGTTPAKLGHESNRSHSRSLSKEKKASFSSYKQLHQIRKEWKTGSDSLKKTGSRLYS
jgi:hypothetical protein